MKTIAGVGLCSLALLLGACSGSTRTGNPYTLKADRELEAYLPGDVRRVHAAALKVVKDEFRYQVVHSATDAREGIIEGKTTTGVSFRIETYRSTDKATRTEVFVGPMGNEETMRDILEEIAEELKN